MACPEHTRSSINRNNIDEDVEVNIDIVGDDDDWGSDFWKMLLSSKYGKLGICEQEQVDGLDGSDRNRSVSDRYESRKRVSSSNRASIDQDDDYDARKESRSKKFKKNTLGNILDELRAFYQDVEAESNIEGQEKPRCSGYVRAEERESKKPDPKNETNVEKILDGDSKISERWDSHRDKGSGYGGRKRSRRWDERSDTCKSVKHAEEFDTRSGGVPSDPKLETSLEKERSDNMENELRNIMGTKFYDRDETQVGSERSEREGTWKRRLVKETRESGRACDNMRDREFPRRGRDRGDGSLRRRKDGSRAEAVKTSSKDGKSNKNSDVTEIQTKPFDLGKEGTRSSFSADGNITQQSKAKPSSDVDEFTYSKEERPQNAHGSIQSGEGIQDGVVGHDQHLLRDADDYQADRSRGLKGAAPNHGSGGFNIDVVGDDDDWGSDFWKMLLSSRYGKPGIGEQKQVDGLDGSDSNRSVSERYETRKRSSSSNRASIDHKNDYDARKESRSKQFKKNTAGNILDELRASYQDVEAECNIEVREKPRGSGYVRAEERESEKPDPKNETNVEKILDGNSKFSERWNSQRDKGPGYGGRERSRRWDERGDTCKSVKHAEEFDTRSGGLPSDPNLETSLEKERSDIIENELRNIRGTKFYDRDETQVGSERSEREGTWKRRQEKETRESGTACNNMRDGELPRRGRDKGDGSLRGRKDVSRAEAVQTSSKYGKSNKNSDVVEIQTKPFDLGKEDARSSFSGDGKITQQSEAKPSSDVGEFMCSKEERSQNAEGSIQSGEGSKDGVVSHDQHLLRDADDHQADRSRGPKGAAPNRGSGGSLTPHGIRTTFQGPVKRNRTRRMVRVRPSNQQSGIPVPLVGSPCGPLGRPPPGLMQSLPPNMSPVPGPPISPAIFIPPFQPPILWPGTQAIDVVPRAPVPSAPIGPRIRPNLGNSLTGVSVFSPPGPGRGILPGVMDSDFNNSVLVRPHSQDKVSGGWVPPSRTNAPTGKAPSRGEQNDYSQNFVDTGMRPQNFIRELELTNLVEDYPRLRELIQKKDEIVAKSASPPMYYKCDLKEQVLSTEFFGTKFDVILVDPPWEEYVHRAPGVTDHMEYWTFEEIMNLKIEAIADSPSFIFLCVGDGIGLEQGRQCLRKWGFRRCEDICWVKTNKRNATPGLRHDSHTLFQRSKEHYLMGIKGAVRRSTDGHVIHANIDTDVIIAEEPPYGSTAKPEDMYRIIEHFALGRRRLELFGEDHNIREGWLTVGKGLSSSNFNQEAYVKNFADKDGKVWVGGRKRNPPPEAPHLVLTTPDIESLRPKSPTKNQQQLQNQLSQSASI